MTCGNEIFDQKQQSRIAQKIHDQLVAEGRDQIPLAEVKKLLQKEEQEKKAEEFKNRLLEFDRTSAKRTRVIGLPSFFIASLLSRLSRQYANQKQFNPTR